MQITWTLAKKRSITITMSYVMDFEILVMNNYKRRAMSQVLELRGNDGHWETDLDYYRTVTFIFMTMHLEDHLL